MCNQYDYEHSWPIVYGGNTGDYAIQAPWHGPAEMMIVSAYIQTNGAAYISRSETTAGASSSIATTNQAGTNGTEGIYVNANPDGSMAIAPYWMPFNGRASLQVVGTALVTIAFRRRRMLQASAQMDAVQGAKAPQATVMSASQDGTLPTNPYKGGF
jgi:hypothetical protein